MLKKLNILALVSLLSCSVSLLSMVPSSEQNKKHISKRTTLQLLTTTLRIFLGIDSPLIIQEKIEQFKQQLKDECKDFQKTTATKSLVDAEPDILRITTLWENFTSLYRCNMFEEIINYYGEPWDNMDDPEQSWSYVEKFKTKELSRFIHPDKRPDKNQESPALTSLFQKLETTQRDNPSVFLYGTAQIIGQIQITSTNFAFDALEKAVNHVLPYGLHTKEMEKHKNETEQLKHATRHFKQETLNNYYQAQTMSKTTNFTKKQ